jgi:hypothetical protein
MEMYSCSIAYVKHDAFEAESPSVQFRPGRFGIGLYQLVLGLFLAGNRMQKKAEANAPAILDKAFMDDDVVFKVNLECQAPGFVETFLVGN